VQGALGRREQVILLLNRRGFATYLQCPACGDVRDCPHCAIALTVHQTPPAFRCHYCGHEETIPTACRMCGKEVQRMRGLGTQQLEHFVVRRFPAASIARMDLDTTSSKWAHHRILERMAQGKLDILLGTQMIAKGLDFPNVTVVGVVDADTGLHLPDFRAAERTFQLVAQVAGRAGGPRGDACTCRPGRRTTTPYAPPRPTRFPSSPRSRSRCVPRRIRRIRRTSAWRVSWRRTKWRHEHRKWRRVWRHGCDA